MEQTGANKNETLGTLHWYDTATSSNALYGETIAVANASSEFHLYSLERTQASIKIFVDDVMFFEMENDATLPFYDKDFFMILNVAMGGSLGGTIDPAFTEDSMEIDYIEFYQ
jgi:beta-glucanase (GH16 family)